jgi:transcriptional regulator with XRE-family HTH domain
MYAAVRTGEVDAMCEPLPVAELRVMRARYDVTQDEVGRRLGFTTKGLWSKVERGQLKLHPDFLDDFERACIAVAADKAAARALAAAGAQAVA